MRPVCKKNTKSRKTKVCLPLWNSKPAFLKILPLALPLQISIFGWYLLLWTVFTIKFPGDFRIYTRVLTGLPSTRRRLGSKLSGAIRKRCCPEMLNINPKQIQPSFTKKGRREFEVMQSHKRKSLGVFLLHIASLLGIEHLDVWTGVNTEKVLIRYV